MSREVPDSARAGDSRSARSPGLHRRDGAGFCCLFHRPAATARAIDLDIPESDVPEKRGEIHVKAGYLNGSPYYAVKIVSGFASNLQRGLPPNDGMVVVFDAIPAPQPRSSSTMDLSPTSEPGPQARSPRNILRARTLSQSR